MHFNIPVKRVKGGCFCTGHPNTEKKNILNTVEALVSDYLGTLKKLLQLELVAYENELS